MICIYHSKDLDGHSSAAIVKKRYPEAKLIGYDYGEPIPYDLIPAGEPIIMADVSFKMPEMLELAKHSLWQLTWIDHHISAINDYKEFSAVGDFLVPVLQNGIAACEGTWNYLFPGKQMPIGIKLLGEYDTWRNSDKEHWENDILPFQFGMRILCNSPETFPAEVFMDSGGKFIDDIIAKGETVLKYQSQVNSMQCKKASFEIEFEGLRAICLNSGGGNSDVFKSVYDEDKHDIMMPFQFNGNSWGFSIYSTKPSIDCSLIAKKHGGGGHAAAAGFKVQDLSTIIKRSPAKP